MVVMLHENTAFSSNLHMNINYQQVSDDYYLQDVSSNLAIMTQNQLLRHGDLTYTTDHRLLSVQYKVIKHCTDYSVSYFQI